MRPPGTSLVVAASIVALLGSFGATFILVRPSAPEIDPGDAAQVALGRQVYAEACASCHGSALEGQAGWRSRNADGSLPAPPHDATGHTWHHPAAQLYQIVAQGPAALVGGGYRSAMPGFADTLDELRIAAVVAYLISSWPPEIRSQHAAIEARVGGRD